MAVAIVAILALLVVPFSGIAGLGSGDADPQAASPALDDETDMVEFAPEPGLEAAVEYRPASLSSVAATSDNPFAPTPPDDERVVVRFEDDHVVTGSAADDLPPEPAITVEETGTELVIDEHDEYDLPVMQTTDGDVATADGKTIHRVNEDPDLVTFDDETVGEFLEVDRSTGEVQTVDSGTTVTVNEDTEDERSVVYSAYDERNYTVEITDVDEVDEGESLSVSATVNNSRWAHAGGETAILRILEGETALASGDRDSSLEEHIGLDGGEETDVTFTYETTAGDYLADGVEVVIDDSDGVDGDTDSAPVEIGAAGVSVAIVETNTAVEGSDLIVTAEITRYGDIPEGTQNYPISLFVDDTEEQTDIVPLSPGESTTRTFTYETDEDDVGEVEAMVSSRVDSSSTVAPVLSIEAHENNINTTITDATPGNLSGDLTVDASFAYDGEIPYGELEFPANLTVDGMVTDQRNVTIDGSSPTNETFVHARNTSEPPITNATIETPGKNEWVTFDRDTDLEFSNVTDPGARNESLSATVSVENTGETPGQIPLTVAVPNVAAVDSNATETTTFDLNPGESASHEVTFDLSDNAPPQLEVRANTSTTVETRQVDVRDNEPRFEIDDATVTEASAGDDDNATVLTVSSTIRNTGGVSGTQDVSLEFDGETVHTEEVTLEPDEERTLSTDVEVSDDSTYAYGAETDDDAVSKTTDVARESSATMVPWDGLSLNALAMPLLALTALGLAIVGAAVIKQRTDPDDIPVEIPDELSDEIHQRMAALQPAARRVQSAARNLVSNDGTGTIVVQNNLPRKALVRIRVRSGDDVRFLEDFELAADERRTLECLPDGDGFAVGSGVDDIAAHEATFDSGTDEVGVILQPEGITIKEL